MMIVKVSVSDT